MEEITVTIKAADLARLMLKINMLTDDVNYRDMQIKKLKQDIEHLKQKENEK